MIKLTDYILWIK